MFLVGLKPHLQDIPVKGSQAVCPGNKNPLLGHVVQPIAGRMRLEGVVYLWIHPLQGGVQSRGFQNCVCVLMFQKWSEGTSRWLKREGQRQTCYISKVPVYGVDEQHSVPIGGDQCGRAGALDDEALVDGFVKDGWEMVLCQHSDQGCRHAVFFGIVELRCLQV